MENNVAFNEIANAVQDVFEVPCSLDAFARAQQLPISGTPLVFYVECDDRELLAVIRRFILREYEQTKSLIQTRRRTHLLSSKAYDLLSKRNFEANLRSADEWLGSIHAELFSEYDGYAVVVHNRVVVAYRVPEKQISNIASCLDERSEHAVRDGVGEVFGCAADQIKLIVSCSEDHLGEAERKMLGFLAGQLHRTRAEHQSSLQADELRALSRAILDDMPSILLTMGPDGRVIEWNHEAEKSSRIKRSEAINQPLSAVWPMMYQLQKQSLSSSNPLGPRSVAFSVGEFDRQGILTQYEVQTHAGVVVVMRLDDVTEHRQLEERLRAAERARVESSKMEALGRLASGMAHDLNNLFAAQRLSVDMLREPDCTKEESKELLAEVDETLSRATELVRRLLDFSRGYANSLKEIDLNDSVKKVIKIVERLIPENIVVVEGLSPKPLWIKTDVSQIEQVVMNLVVNAKDAVGEDGRIWVKTRIENNTTSVLEIIDNGHGISPENKDKLFEPFFTTKDIGKGTGLGLATVYQIVTSLGGTVEVDSAPGHGAKFIVRLPLRKPVRHLKPLPSRPLQSQSTSSESKILLVDDDVRCRRMLASIMSRAGYEVVQLGSPAEFDTWEGDLSSINLLAFDLRMPGASGFDLAERVLDREPNIPVLFISGYTEQSHRLLEWQSRGAQYLRKPCTADELLSSVRALVEEPTTAVLTSP